MQLRPEPAITSCESSSIRLYEPSTAVKLLFTKAGEAASR
jgi:hypothetical protein